MNAKEIIFSKERIKKDHLTEKYWDFKYNDLVKCYANLQVQLQEVSKRSKLLQAITIHKEADKRKLNIPETTNGWYGLMMTDDFKYISTAFERPPVPQEYKINFEMNSNI